MLLDVDKGHTESDPVFEEILSYLERSLPGCIEPWAGDFSSLYSANDQLASAIATLYMLLDRWLHLFECVPDYGLHDICSDVIAVIWRQANKANV